VFDFYRQLRSHPTYLEVLGNGKQRKSYLYVQDCLEAMLLAVSRAGARVNLFNLGVDSYCEVNDSIAWISAELGLEPRVIYGGGERGWAGDSPFIFLDTTRIRALGWQPKLGIEAGIRKTVSFLHDNVWVLDSRS
jgi:UDP-glucose 4-epimerase